MGHKGDVSWTDEEVERLREYAGRGFSAAEISAMFGGRRGRSAVIGAIWRYGLNAAWRDGRDRAGSTSAGAASAPIAVPDLGRPVAVAKPKPVDKPKPAIAPAAAPAPAPAPSPPAAAEHVTIVDLQNCHCRWPIGDPFDFDSFRYCGGVKLPITPYCLEHTLRSLSPEGQARFRRQYQATAA